MLNTNHWLAQRTKFFYGWAILPVSILASFATSPGQTYMVSVFTPSFRDTLGLSLTQLTGAYMFGTILASLPQSYVGMWIDRLGIRKVTLFILTAFSLACVFISQVNSLFTIFLGFFLIRVFGQGALELLSTNMLPMWFREKLGTISSIKNVGVNLLISTIPISILALIKGIGWSNTYLIAGATVFGVMVPVVYFIFINRPEDIGQIVDGNPYQIKKPQEIAVIPPDEVTFTLRMAMRTRAYWILTLAWFSLGAINTGIVFNLLPIFTSKGFTEEQAAATFSALMIVSAVFQIVGGVFADRIKLKYLAFGGLALFSVAILVLALVSSNYLIPIYIGLLGFSHGLFGALNNTVWVRYYGREHLGKIRGSVWTVTVAGSSVGPFLMGLSYDQSGSFQFSLLVFGGIMVCLAIAGLWATPPNPAISQTA
jgi:OFA family oxalate/formate antiporter-like MFS transporter